MLVTYAHIHKHSFNVLVTREHAQIGREVRAVDSLYGKANWDFPRDKNKSQIVNKLLYNVEKYRKCQKNQGKTERHWIMI